MHTKLFLQLGEAGRLFIETQVPLQTRTIEWRTQSQVVVLDEDRQYEPTDMKIHGIAEGGAYVDFRALTADGELIMHTFEILVEAPAANSKIMARARPAIRRKDVQKHVPASLATVVSSQQALEQQQLAAANDIDQNPKTAAMENQAMNPEKTEEKTMPATHGIDTLIDAPRDGETVIPEGEKLQEIGLTRPEENSVTPEEKKTNEDLTGSLSRIVADPEEMVKEDINTEPLNNSTDKIHPENADAMKSAEELEAQIKEGADAKMDAKEETATETAKTEETAPEAEKPAAKTSTAKTSTAKTAAKKSTKK